MSPLIRNASYALKEVQIMFKDERPTVTCIIAGRFVEALVFNEPSQYGINGGRVSRLTIYKRPMRDRTIPWLDDLDYNFCRHDEDEFVSNIPEADIAVVVAALEKLEPVKEKENA